jgi:hypothetical protein
MALSGRDREEVLAARLYRHWRSSSAEPLEENC